MNLRYKLLLGFLFSSILVAVVGYVSHSLNRSIRDRLVRVNSRSIYLMEYTGEMAMILNKSLMNTREYLDAQMRLADLESGSVEKRKNIRATAKRAEEKVHNQLKQFKTYMKKSLRMAHQIEGGIDSLQMEKSDTLFHKSMMGQLKVFRKKFSIYESLLLELFKLSDNSYKDGRELLTVTLEPFFKTTLMPLVDRVRSRAHQRVDQETARLEESLNFSVQTILFVSILAVITAMAIGYAIYRQISHPLNELTRSVRRIGEGNLDERIDIDSDDEIGTLAASFNQMVGNLDKTTVSRNYFNNIIESLSDALVVIDKSYNILKINQALKDLTGYDMASLKELNVIELFEQGEQERVEKQLRGAVPSAAGYIETKLVTRDDERKQVSFSVSQLTENFNQKGYVCLIRDITERKEAEEQIEKSLEEKKVLLAEIHHRVKNNLAVISSLLQMQLHNADNESVRALLRNSVLRIQSIALIHEKLYQNETLAFIDYKTYLKDLIETIEQSFSEMDPEITVKTEISPVSLNVNQAIPCSLFINEVVVNSFKHAFVERDSGSIKVTMTKQDETAHLEIRDDGVGLPEDFKPEKMETMGMTLVYTLAKQLSGDINIYNDNGVVYELDFPIE